MVSIGGDVVVGIAQTEDDIPLEGSDTIVARDADLSAVDGDVAIGVDARTIIACTTSSSNFTTADGDVRIGADSSCPILLPVLWA